MPVPLTFYANVYLDFDLASCEIEAVRAFAMIPSEVAGILVNDPNIRDISIIN